MSFEPLSKFVPLLELIDEMSEQTEKYPGEFDKNWRISTAAKILHQQLHNRSKDELAFYEVRTSGLPLKTDSVADEVQALLLRLGDNIHYLPVGLFVQKMDRQGHRIHLKRADKTTRNVLTWKWHEEYCSYRKLNPNDTRDLKVSYPMHEEYCRYRGIDPTREPENVTPSELEMEDAVRLCGIGFDRAEIAAFLKPLNIALSLDTDTPAAQTELQAGEPDTSDQAEPKYDWRIAAVEIANDIGSKRWESGQREITARNICGAVAIELAYNIKSHGQRGARVADSVRGALKGWKFRPKNVE